MKNCRSIGRTVRGVALAAAALTCAAALAAPAQRAVTVRYADLKLDTPAGAAALYARIKGAARFVCGDEGRTLFEQRIYAQCYTRSVAGAARTVNSPLLSTLVEGGKTSPPTALAR